MKPLKRRAIKLVVVLRIIVGLAAVVALIPKAEARIQCVSRANAAQMLLNNHGEHKVSQGVTASGGILAIFVNPETRAWSLVAIIPDPPQACMMSNGQGWETFKHEPLAPEVDLENHD